MNVYTVEEMRERDLRTLRDQGMETLELVEKAAREIFDVLTSSICPQLEGKQFLILCGKGNNGADGLALAKLLQEEGARTLVVWTSPLEGWAGAGKILADSWEDGMYLKEVPQALLGQWLEESDYIVDGILGTGCSHPVEGDLYEIIDRINESPVPVISLDIPSGLDGNNGIPWGNAVQAEHTIVVDSFKTGNLLGESCDYAGNLLVTQALGLWRDPDPVYVKTRITEEDQYLPPRSQAAHKYDFGKLTVVGGARGMSGAPVMAAMAGLRTGCGLSSILSYGDWEASISGCNLELMVDSFGDEEELLGKLGKTTAVVFGPGTMYREKDMGLLERVIQSGIPVVVDGGAIEALNGLRDRIQLSAHRVIATPHAGEMARLFRVTSKEVLKDPLYFVEAFLESYQTDLILKGPCTLVASGREICFAYGPNSGMATAGSGDVLAGLVGGFLAQGYSSMDAMKNGALVHQIAGRQASEKYGERSMTATDILDSVHVGVRALEHIRIKDVNR